MEIKFRQVKDPDGQNPTEDQVPFFQSTRCASRAHDVYTCKMSIVHFPEASAPEQTNFSCDFLDSKLYLLTHYFGVLSKSASLSDRRDALSRTRASLPIAAARTHLMDTIAAHEVVVIVGETGSGKTTQVEFL